MRLEKGKENVENAKNTSIVKENDNGRLKEGKERNTNGTRNDCEKFSKNEKGGPEEKGKTDGTWKADTVGRMLKKGEIDRRAARLGIQEVDLDLEKLKDVEEIEDVIIKTGRHRLNLENYLKFISAEEIRVVNRIILEMIVEEGEDDAVKVKVREEG